MADAEAVDMRLWGKERGLGGARYPVVCHGLDAAAAVRALWTQFVAPGLRRRLAEAVGLDESQTCALLEFWASLHDIGKLTPSFAHQLEMPPEFGAPCGVRLAMTKRRTSGCRPGWSRWGMRTGRPDRRAGWWPSCWEATTAGSTTSGVHGCARNG